MPLERNSVTTGQQVVDEPCRQSAVPLVNNNGVSLADDTFVQDLDLIPESDRDANVDDKEARRLSGHFVMLSKEHPQHQRQMADGEAACQKQGALAARKEGPIKKGGRNVDINYSISTEDYIRE